MNTGLKILIITGVYEELFAIIRNQSVEFNRRFRGYRFQWGSYNILAISSGPGVQKPAKLERIMKEWSPVAIINAGFVGILTRSSIRPGDRVPVSRILFGDRIYETNHPSTGVSIFCSNEPVFDPDTKQYIHETSGAVAIDMESGPLEEIRRRSKMAPILYCKVAGDRLLENQIYRHESDYRGFIKKGTRSKILELALNPKRILPYLFLFFRKRKLQRLLEQNLYRILDDLTIQDDRKYTGSP